MDNLPAKENGTREHRENLHRLLGEMLINITDQAFTERSIYIDGYRFINCIFHKCHLVAQRGTFEFHKCLLLETSPQFNMEAMKSVQLYFSTTEKEKACNSVFKPKLHDDGTISIAHGASLF